jgi:hypothetical protein
MKFINAVLAFSLLVVGGVSAQTPRKPPAPHTSAGTTDHATYYGAIDVGSKGTKAALYSFVTDEDGPSPDLLFSQNVNTKLVSSMADGKFTPAGIEDATQAVTTLIAAINAEAKKRGISVDIFYIVGSSGAAKASNKADLVASVKQATGIEMDFIDAAHEGYYGMMSAVPLSRRMNAMYLDIGSGNAKLGCLVGGSSFQNFKSAEIAYGSVSGRNEALKRSPNDVVAGLDSVMQDVSAAYTKQSLDIPCLRNRHFIYWSGGASWATATYTHPERALRGYVPITRHDLDSFLASLKDGTWNQRAPSFVFPKDMPLTKQAAIKAKALKDRDDVQNVFVREDLLSGDSIMKTVLESSNPASFIQFVRNGNYIYGYALDKYMADAATGTK